MNSIFRSIKLTVRNTVNKRQVTYYGVTNIKMSVTKDGNVLYTISFIHDNKTYNAQVNSKNWDVLVILHEFSYTT